MAQVQFVNVPGVGRVRLGDYVHTRLRGAIRPATTQSADLFFFRHSAGDQIQGGGATDLLTEYDTNIQQKDGLPPGWAAMVYFLSVECQSDITLADIQDLNRKTLFTLVIGSINKTLDDGHLIHYGQGGGVAGATTANNQQAWTNGVAAGGARTAYAVPHFIPSKPRLPFTVRTSWPGSAGGSAALAQGVRSNLWCNLEGIVRLPVG